MVKTPCFHGRGMGLIPGWGTKIPHAAPSGQINKYKCDRAFSLGAVEETNHTDSICHDLLNMKGSQIYAARIIKGGMPVLKDIFELTSQTNPTASFLFVLCNKTSFLFKPLLGRKKLKGVVASLTIFYHKFDFLN